MTYSSSVVGRVRAIIAGLLLTLVLAIAAPFLLHEAGVSWLERDLLGGSALAVAVIGTVWTLAHVLVLAPVTVRTSPTHVEVTRGRRVRENWARSTTGFSSFIVRQSTNGIRTGTTRKLIATTASEQVEVTLPWFDAATYNALIADVAPLVPAAADSAPSAASAARSMSSRTFSIERSSRRLTVRLALIGVAIVVLAVVGASIALEFDASLPAIPAAALGAVLVFAVIAFPLVRSERAIPRSLTVSQSTLQFDDRVFPVGQLSAIRATPPSYTDQRRSIVLVDTTGRRSVIPLGHANDRSFHDYAQFVEAVRQATAHRPGILTLEVA